MNDPLTYLQGDSEGPKRDLIAKYYYQVAQGDPNSSPVAFAVLLDACAEQLGKVPEELQQATAEFKKTVAEARDLERRVIERTDKSNASVIAAFREETHRAHTAWTETFQYAQTATEKAERLAKAITPLTLSAGELAGEFHVLRGDLRQHRESVSQQADIAEKVRSIQADSLAVVKRLTRQSQTNRVTIGVLFGMMAYGFGEQSMPPDLPFFYRMGILVTGLAVIQWLVNTAWNALRKGG